MRVTNLVVNSDVHDESILDGSMAYRAGNITASVAAAAGKPDSK